MSDNELFDLVKEVRATFNVGWGAAMYIAKIILLDRQMETAVEKANNWKAEQ